MRYYRISKFVFFCFTVTVVIGIQFGVVINTRADGLNTNKFKTVIDSRPRLYFPLRNKETLRTSITKDPYRKFWISLKKRVDFHLHNKSKKSLDDYKDIRKFGYHLIDLAFVSAIEEKKTQVQQIKKRMNSLVSYQNWGNNDSLDAASLLFAMVLTYDWQYQHFSPSERLKYRTKIKRHANLLEKTLKEKRKRWTKAYLQNMNYTITMAIGIAGYALLGEEKDAINWLESANSNLDTVLQYLSPDGSSHEGINYWSYGLESILFYFYAVKPLYGFSKLENHPFFQKTAQFRLFCSLPGYKQNADFADSYRIEYHGPGSILRALASINQDGYAQGLAENIEKARGRKALYSWFDFFSYNPEVPSVLPDNLPTYRYFDNLGLFILRSDWTQKSLWALFKAGPSQGKLAEQKKYYAGSHIHPDQGNFSIWHKGDWLVIDDGYSLIKKTSDHNVLLFNKIGQLGEGGEWFDEKSVKKHKGTVKVIHVDISNDYHYFSADLTKIYPPDSNLKLWTRDFIYIPHDWIIISDTVELTRPGKVRSHIHFKKQNLELHTSNQLLESDKGIRLYYKLPFKHEISLKETHFMQRVYGIPTKTYRKTLAISFNCQEKTRLLFVFDLANGKDKLKKRTISFTKDRVILHDDIAKIVDFVNMNITTN